MAALSGNSELVASLLACGADPNKASDLGTTALHNAVRFFFLLFPSFSAISS